MPELNPATIMTAIMLTWGVGLAPPVVIRYAILRRPMGKWPAIGTCTFFWFFNFFLFTIISGKFEPRGALIFVTLVSYWILRKKGAAKAQPSTAPIAQSHFEKASDDLSGLKGILEQYRKDIAESPSDAAAISPSPLPPDLAGLKGILEQYRGDISESNQMLNQHNSESSRRKELREEFEQATRELHRADDLSQIAVGHGINMVNSMFIRKFNSTDEFCQLPKADRLKYIQSLAAFEETMSQQDPHTALGFGLFKMWVGVQGEGDDELASQFSNELSYFSRKGELVKRAYK